MMTSLINLHSCEEDSMACYESVIQMGSTLFFAGCQLFTISPNFPIGVKRNAGQEAGHCPITSHPIFQLITFLNKKN